MSNAQPASTNRPVTTTSANEPRETDLNAEQENRLVPPLSVTARTATNLTLTVDLSTWFVVGGQLVSPALGLKGKQFESQITENIKQSFEMFKDHDRDGHDDDGDDDDDDD